MYINGILAPDMTLQRGKEYTFVVETGLGSDPDQTFHPLYITSDPIGNIQNLMSWSRVLLPKLVNLAEN